METRRRLEDIKDRLTALFWGAATVLCLTATAVIGPSFTTGPPDGKGDTERPFVGPERPGFSSIPDKWALMAEAFIPVESSGNPLAVNRRSGATGILQLKKIMVREVNRLLNLDLKTSGVWYFTYDDRFDRHRSIQMFKVIMMHHNRSGTIEEAMRIWNHSYTAREKARIVANYKALKASPPNT